MGITCKQMKPIYYTLAVILGMASLAHAQVIVQDASESSSIRYQGAAISFDITQARTSFQLNKFQNALNPDYSKKINFFAVQASANSKEGLASILSSGKVVPEASININIGHSWVNESTRELGDLTSQIIDISKKNGEDRTALTKQVNKVIDDFISANPAATDLNGELAPVKAIGFNLVADAIRAIANKEKYKGNLDDLLKLAATLEAKVTSLLIPITRRENIITQLQESIKSVSSLDRYLIYGILGASGSKFTYLTDPNALNFDKRFQDKKLEAGKVGLGFNWKRGGRAIWGISFTFTGADNFSLLSDTEYVRTSTTTISSTTATTQPTATTIVTDRLDGVKKIIAFSGDVKYDYFNQSAFNLDHVRFYPGVLGEKSVLVANYYLRQKFTSNSAVFPEVTDVGVGGYFFKSKGSFLGGLYIELPDVFNNIERMQTTPSFRPVYNRFSLGIVTKLTFGSV